MSYHSGPLGTVEVFQARDYDVDPEHPQAWYWWACYPGCLPDGDPVGPFDSWAEAIADSLGGDQ